MQETAYPITREKTESMDLRIYEGHALFAGDADAPMEPLPAVSVGDERQELRQQQAPFFFPMYPPKPLDISLEGYVSVEQDEIHGIREQDIRREDVLPGSASRRNHPGNVSYRNLIEERATLYRGASSREAKQMVAMKVVVLIRRGGGRFLTRRSHQDNLHYEMGDDAATDHAAQALQSIGRPRCVPFRPREATLQTVARFLVHTGKLQHWSVNECFPYMIRHFVDPTSLSHGQSDGCSIFPILLYVEEYHDMGAYVDYCVREQEHAHQDLHDRTLERIGRGHRMRLVSLFPILLMKLIVREECCSFASKINLFLGTRQGQTLNQVSSVLEEMALGTRQHREAQEGLLQRILNTLHDWDPVILQLLVHSEPSIEQMENPWQGRVDRRRVLEDFREEIRLTPPGAFQVLRHHFGVQPIV